MGFRLRTARQAFPLSYLAPWEFRLYQTWSCCFFGARLRDHARPRVSLKRRTGVGGSTGTRAGLGVAGPDTFLSSWSSWAAPLCNSVRFVLTWKWAVPNRRRTPPPPLVAKAGRYVCGKLANTTRWAPTANTQSPPRSPGWPRSMVCPVQSGWQPQTPRVTRFGPRSPGLWV